MKKIAYVGNDYIIMHNSTDYIKIEKDGQYVDNKYVDILRRKINSYSDNLKKGDLIIRQLYRVVFADDNFYMIKFRNFRNYLHYDPDEANKINGSLDTKNSVFDYDIIGDFDYVKGRIVEMFSERMEVNIE